MGRRKLEEGQKRKPRSISVRAEMRQEADASGNASKYFELAVDATTTAIKALDEVKAGQLSAEEALSKIAAQAAKWQENRVAKNSTPAA